MVTKLVCLECLIHQILSNVTNGLKELPILERIDLCQRFMKSLRSYGSGTGSFFRVIPSMFAIEIVVELYISI